MNRGSRRALTLALLVVLPVLEIWTIVQVAQAIGGGWTFVLLIASSLIGGWLIKREGARAWSALTASVGGGKLPTRELADAALVLLGGILMLLPGFVTDAVGLLLVLPFTRPVARAGLAAILGRRLLVVTDAHRPGPGSEGPVVQGDVVD